MKRREVIRRRRAAGLKIVEGAKHSHVVRQGVRVSAISRQAEIKEPVVRMIEKQTGVKLR